MRLAPTGDSAVIDGRACSARASGNRRDYLQRGQQPDAATFVAAAAVVPNTATTTAIKPTSFAFIVDFLSTEQSGPSARPRSNVRVQADLKVKPLTFKLG